MKLAEPVYFILLKKALIITTVLICISIAVGLLLARKKFRYKLLKIKPLLGFVLLYFFLWIVIFGGHVFFYSLHADKQFNSFIEAMNSCTSIKVGYYYFLNSQEMYEELSIQDTQTIKNLTQFIEGNDYKWIHTKGRSLTKNYVKYKVFKSDEEIFSFLIIDTNVLLLTSEDRNKYWCSDLDFYTKTNRLLGILPCAIR